MLYKYFPPNLTHVTALPCETQMFSSVTIRWNVLFATKYLTTELAHIKLNMVYLADLLVVMTDGLKIVRIRAWNVPRVHGHKLLDDGAFLASLSRSTKATVSRADVPGSCWYIKKRLRNHKKSSLDNLHMSGSGLWARKKVVTTVCPVYFDTKSEQLDCNKSSVR